MNKKTDIFGEINRNIEIGKPFAMATIVQTAGSSPRRTGARMLVYTDGSIYGTIGGGNFEKMVIDDCVGLFNEGNSEKLKKYSFSQEGKDSTGMCCGGEAKVFMEVYGKPKKLVIFGGGHVARELVKAVGDLSFSIVVVDDRREILDGYGPGVNTVLTDSEYLENHPQLDRNCFVVIVTRSHKCDRNALLEVLKHECAYVGMIGSLRKVRKVLDSLKESGVSDEKLSHVKAPVGLDIGAEGPYEIAISIAAELIAAEKGKLEKFK